MPKEPASPLSGRFSEPALLIMASLAGGPKHGYALMQEIASEAGVRLGPGTLYGALSRLEDAGYVVACEGDERRRPYALSAAGRRAFAARMRDLEQFHQSLRRLTNER